MFIDVCLCVCICLCVHCMRMCADFNLNDFLSFLSIDKRNDTAGHFGSEQVSIYAVLKKYDFV